MKQEGKLNPFEAPVEDLEIKNVEEEKEAKGMAGVVSEQEHIERLLTSGDKKLIQAGLEQLNKQLQEKDDVINDLQQQVVALEKDKMRLDKVREALLSNDGKDKMIIKGQDGETRIWKKGIKENLREMSKEKFEAEFGTSNESIGEDPRALLEDLEQSTSAWLGNPWNYLERISLALKDENKEVVVVENQAYIVDKK